MSRDRAAGRVRRLAILMGALTVPGGEVQAQLEGMRYGVVLTNAWSARNPVEGAGPSGIGEVMERLRPGSVELQASLPLHVRPRWRLDYSFGLIPLTWVRGSLIGEGSDYEARGTSFGVGVTPLRLRVVVRASRMALEASIAGGVLRYGHPTPVTSAARSNFHGSVSAGLRVRLLGLDVGGGYRRTHISNAGRADFNPGIDSADLYLGVWLR